MRSFEYLPIMAMFCYMLIFLLFMSARKNQIICSFLMLLASLICWSGGSFLMRIQAWPSYGFWYDVSFSGLLLQLYFSYVFISNLFGLLNKPERRYWLIATLIICFLNTVNGFFMEQPALIVKDNDHIVFEHNMTWHVGILIIFSLGILGQLFCMIFKNNKVDKLLKKQMTPMILGIVIMLIGNLLLFCPGLKGFPIDILSALINALLMLYTLLQRRLFRLKLLNSEYICYTAALLLALIVFYNFSPGLIHLIEHSYPFLRGSRNHIVVLGSLFVVVAFVFESIWSRMVGRIFIKEELMQKGCLQRFTLEVSKSLQIQEICQAIVTVLKNGTDMCDIYICMQKGDQQPFKIVYTENQLKNQVLSLRPEHPLIQYLMYKESFVILKDFVYDTDYKFLWQMEKRVMKSLGIKYAMALKDQSEMVGIILLSDKEKYPDVSDTDISFFHSVGSIASIAIKNSRLYEALYKEVITDELTGLLNRSYFCKKVEALIEKCQESSLVLIAINLDDFKLYNQLYGVEKGDRALQKAAHIIKVNVGDQGFASRYDGKEFMILLPEYDVIQAKKMAGTISHQIYTMNKDMKEYEIKRLTCSIGVSAYPYCARTAKELFSNVDLAVYNVKAHGKNGIRIFESIAPGEQIEDGVNPKKIYLEYETTIEALTAAIDTKDHYTFSHSNNVAYYATMLGKAVGLPVDMVEIIRQAALLHDIGKIGIPESILNKPGKLTAEEFEVIKGHVEASIGIIKHLPSLDYVIPAVLGHHERYDGKGYPRQIAGEDIPLTSRILCVADSFDAMVSKRCYKNSIPLYRAKNILCEEAGHQFDPGLVKIFVELLEAGKVKIPEEEMNMENR